MVIEGPEVIMHKRGPKWQEYKHFDRVADGASSSLYVVRLARQTGQIRVVGDAVPIPRTIGDLMPRTRTRIFVSRRHNNAASFRALQCAVWKHNLCVGIEKYCLIIGRSYD